MREITHGKSHVGNHMGGHMWKITCGKSHRGSHEMNHMRIYMYIDMMCNILALYYIVRNNDA